MISFSNSLPVGLILALLSFPSGSQQGPYEVKATLRIGEIEGQDAYVMGYVSDIAGDRAGRIYVSDMQLVRVQVYDSAGSWIRTVGRFGEGPGEMRRPASVAELGRGNWAVFDLDQNAYLFFNSEGEPTARVPSPHRPHAFDWIEGDGLGRLLDSRRARDRQYESFYVLRIPVPSSESPPVDSVLVHAVPETVVDVSVPERGFSQGVMRVPLAPSTTWTGIPDGVVYSEDGRYVIQRVRFGGGRDTLLIGPLDGAARIPDWVREQFLAEPVGRLEDAAERIDVDVQRWMEQLVVPEVFPEVIRLLRGPFDRLWVLTGDMSGRPRLDVWSKEGEFIGAMVLDTKEWPEVDMVAVSGTHVLGRFTRNYGVHEVRGFPIPEGLRASELGPGVSH